MLLQIKVAVQRQMKDGKDDYYDKIVTEDKFGLNFLTLCFSCN